MQTDGRTQTYGKRETTLVGYAPAPVTPEPRLEDVASGADKQAAPDGHDIERDIAPPNEPATNLVANLAGALEPASESEAEIQAPGAWDGMAPLGLAAVGADPADHEAADELLPVTVGLGLGDRRNPLSRRLPINRGRHLSRTFFEEGDRQEQTGWENSPLAAEPFGASSTRLGFSSFDHVPRKRAPMIALAAGIGMAAALLGGWSLGWWSPRGQASTDVWSALRVPGAGWQPPVVTTTTAPQAPARALVAAPAPAPVVPTAQPSVAVTAPPPVAPPAAAKPTAPVAAKAAAPTRAFAPTADAKPRPQAPRALGPATAASRRHALAARRVQPRGPIARTAAPARPRPKVPAAAAATASSTTATPPAAAEPASEPRAVEAASSEPALPAASAAPEAPPAEDAEPAAAATP